MLLSFLLFECLTGLDSSLSLGLFHLRRFTHTFSGHRMRSLKFMWSFFLLVAFIGKEGLVAWLLALLEELKCRLHVHEIAELLYN